MRLALLLLLPGCLLDDRDLDGDGALAWEDCDDLDASIGPGVEETLGDGIDQDCDGADLVLRVLGGEHGCALDDRGDLYCSGRNAFGQLDVPPDHEWTDVAVGALHTCGLTRSGQVLCWGDDRFGQATPPTLTSVESVNATDWSSFAEVDGALVCWGACRVK